MIRKLNIEETLKRIKEYAENSGKNRPLLIRTDSVVTSDILRDASESIVKNSKKVSNSNSVNEAGLNILYNWLSDKDLSEQEVNRVAGNPFVYIVDPDFEVDDEIKERFSFIECVNDDALTFRDLVTELEKLPEDLYVFARIDYISGLFPLEVNYVTKQCVAYVTKLDKLPRVKQMLDEIQMIKNSNRSVIYDGKNFPVEIVYDEDADYVTIEMVSKKKFVDRLVNRLVKV